MLIVGMLLCNQGAVVSYKAFGTVSQGNKRIAPVFMAFWTCVLGVIMTAATVIITGGFRPSMVTLVAAVTGGLCFAAAGVISIHIMATGPFIWSVLMMNLSSFLPVLYAPVFLGEAVRLPQIGGVVLILSILFIMNAGIKGGGSPFTTRWMALAVVNLLVNGAVLCAQKTQSSFTGGGESLELLSLMFIFTSVFAGIYSLVTPGRKERPPYRAVLPPAFGLVGSIGFGNVFSMALMGRVPAAVQFPVIVGAGIVLSSILSVLLYKERPGWRLYLSALLLIAGVALLGL